MGKDSNRPEKNLSETAAVAQQSAMDTIDAMGEGVALLALDGVIKSVNPAFATFVGIAKNELEGRNAREVIPEIFEEEPDEIVETMVRISLKESKNDPRDALKISNSGNSERWLIPALTTIKASENESIGLVLTVRDVTALMEAQFRVRESERQYEKRLRRLADMLATSEQANRRQISSQIHDTVIQTLSLANIRMGALRKELESRDVEESQKKIDQIRKQIDQGITECRHMMAELTPPLLYEVGLVPALREFVDSESELQWVDISLEAEELPGKVEEAERGLLYQATRELVMNALKHAGPCRIAIRLYSENDTLYIEVKDDGSGFDPATADLFDSEEEEGGFGLFNIRERLQALGGACVVDSTPGDGTVARIEVPLGSVAG